MADQAGGYLRGDQSSQFDGPQLHGSIALDRVCVELPRFRGQVIVLVPSFRLLDVHRS